MQTFRLRTPAVDQRATDIVRPPEIPRGLDAVVHGWSGRWKSRQKYSDQLWEDSGRLEREQADLRGMKDRELQRNLHHLRQRTRRLSSRWNEAFPEALPFLVEAARRTLRLQAYREQIMGALALGKGALVEMATGEGKTLTIALASAAAGWSGRPVHIITANDYLAERDATYLQPFYKYCGLHAGFITAPMEPQDRKESYEAPVVYCTGKELVSDFLRDRIQLGKWVEPGRRNLFRLLRPAALLPTYGTVLRGIHTAFVDEADNQLIDEAVTPLIISRKEENTLIKEATECAENWAAALLPGEDYETNDRFRETRLLNRGKERIREWCEGQTGFLSATDWMCDLVNQSLQARHYFLKDRQYVIIDGKVVIVDEFTGRMMPGRSWRLGLHQAVEAKEQVEISAPTETLARLSFQRFYRLFRNLSGISGTAREASPECWRVYNLPLIEVPRHKPNQRQDWTPRFFVDQDSKWKAVVEEIKVLHAKGRPILVGTRSVSASEHLGRLLTAQNLTFSLLNAVRHEDEAGIIRMAGGSSRITIATNMAGRGTDIKLGEGVAARGGLHVILSEGHESRRIDRQLMGRSGRQGDPGSTSMFVSMEDELLQRFLPGWGRRLGVSVLKSRVGSSQFLAHRLFRWAQIRASNKSYKQRLAVVKQDRDMAEKLMVGTVDKI